MMSFEIGRLCKVKGVVIVEFSEMNKRVTSTAWFTFLSLASKFKMTSSHNSAGYDPFLISFPFHTTKYNTVSLSKFKAEAKDS